MSTESSRDDFIIAIRSAFLKKGNRQKFSLFTLLIISILVLSLEYFKTGPVNQFRSITKDIIFRGSYVVSSPFKYVKDKYPNKVAQIITFGKLKARMVIRDVGRVLGLAYGFVDTISKMIPFDPSRPQNLTQCIAGEPRLQKLINEDPRVQKLVDLSLKLEGLNRNVATHAAGVVIAGEKLAEQFPLYIDHSSNLTLPSTQYDMYSSENAGLVKFDLLGLKTLTVIDKTIKNAIKKIQISKNKIVFVNF